MLRTVSSRVTLAEPVKMEPGTINLSGASSFGPSSPVKLKRAGKDEAGADEEAKEGEEASNEGNEDEDDDDNDEDGESKEGSEEDDEEDDEDAEDDGKD